MPAASKTSLAILPLLALLAACDAAPYHEGHAVSAAPPPDLSGALGAPVVVAQGGAPVSGSTIPVTPLPVRLSAPELASTFSNNTAEGVSSTGAPYAAYFAGDGAEHFRAGSFEDSGRWRVLADGRLCTTLPSLGDGAESCYVMYRNGTTLTFAAPDGTALGTVTVVAGDPMNL
ncbi:MAG TPA: hypothetical protein VLX85_00535 [Stellaceae bacterium]|nr:hypothetical protein [Stellaceae bacterium]